MKIKNNGLVSIIIAARNNGKYLEDAISSALNQTYKDIEVIYVDDCSKDDSVAIARKLLPDYKIYGFTQHLGVVEARNTGFDVSSGDYLIFLDGDDILPENYVERMLEVVDTKTALVYCDIQQFGDFDNKINFNVDRSSFLWNQNYIHSASLINRKFFKIAGKWRELGFNTHWDWDLSLRLSKIGEVKKSTAILNYRKHSESNLRRVSKLDIDLSGIIKQNVNLTIGLVYSGRLPELFKIWLSTLVCDCKILKNKPQLIIVDNSGTLKEKHSGILNFYDEHFSEIRIISGYGNISETDRETYKNKLCSMLADTYNIILENSTGDLIHLREDDIISDNNSFEKIFNEITRKGITNIVGVAGIYLNRHNPTLAVGGDFDKEKINIPLKTETKITEYTIPVDYTGTGYIIFWKAFSPFYSAKYFRIQAHDWTWCDKVKRNLKRIVMIPSANVKHYFSEKEFIQYENQEIIPSNTYSKLTINNLDI